MSMRVLVPFEDLRYLYRDLLVRAIRNSRPTLNVRSASLEKLAHVLLHFEPHVVVCSQPSSAHPVGSGAWVQVPTDNPSEDYDQLAQLCLDGEHWLTEGPPLSELFAVIDEAKERLDEGTADLLFTGVRGSGILRTSPLRSSPKLILPEGEEGSQGLEPVAFL